jgi:transposase
MEAFMYSNPRQWSRLRKRVLVSGESIRKVAQNEGMSRNTLKKILTHDIPTEYRRIAAEVTDLKSHEIQKPKQSRSPKAAEKQRWMEWLYALESGPTSNELDDPASILTCLLTTSSAGARKKVLMVLAYLEKFSANAISAHLGVSRNTVKKHLSSFQSGGVDQLLARKPRIRKADEEPFKKALFALLHEPPSLSGFNRTTWRMVDLKVALAAKGFTVGRAVISEAIKKSGFRWRSAKIVLTSNDPDYREKLHRVQSILANLESDERFFSIDEFGPFAIKTKAGRMLVEAGVSPSVPQWQKSKGWLIATAALELSENQVTHFYSRAKNTTEMIKMAGILLEKYSDARTLYISWDAASWHMSKELIAFVNQHNKVRIGPSLELVPLPASAQFLNVIESVFSGMARAIIHSSDYQSVKHATDAIDRYFDERNQHYQENPKRAGKKIWGKERVESVFDTANNCKDPAYR